MPETTEPTWEQSAAEDPELFEWYDDATRALSEVVREHIARYSIEHPPPPRPFPVRLELTKEIRFLFPDGQRQNARRQRQRETAGP